MTRTTTTPLRRETDEGLSLIEVLVALMVFAIISTGIVAGMTTIVRMTTDNHARVTAANLASQDIDLVRAIGDPFSITAGTSTVTVDGRTYSVARSTSWVSKAGADISCGSSTNLMYLRVNVRVTWPDMLTTTAAVQDDTIIAPQGSINDTSTGSIGVSVSGSDGGPETGVAVTVTPTSGGAALKTQPNPTNGNGCTYANGVAPGTYSVTISKSGWISADTQATTSTRSVTVTAGTTQSPSFALYDQAATFSVSYVAGPATVRTFSLPTSFETTWLNTSGVWTTTSPAASTTRFPYTSGYGVVAGLMQSGASTCASVDPQAWPAATVSGVNLAAGVRASAAAVAGGTGTVSVPVGVVWVKAPAGYTLGATQATPASGTPSCGISGSVYIYATPTTGAYQAVALPYGSWKFYYGTSTSSAQQVPAASELVMSNWTSTGVAADGTVTLDPRAGR